MPKDMKPRYSERQLAEIEDTFTGDLLMVAAMFALKQNREVIDFESAAGEALECMDAVIDRMSEEVE